VIYTGCRPRCTDDIFKSTVHRAANKNIVDRYSIALFFGTDYEVNIEASQLNIVSRYLMGLIRYITANPHLRDS
jgi:hypothetical protein